ncbi:MAG: UDP-N-acetylglucosamine-N-acetylmuramyl-(pentapeptide)pyrophosphoryl-undecaprenol N-acetylglucosamine transferase 2, partial [uncultured bacterium]
MPHIAVVERLKSLDPSLKILYLGSAKGPERCLVTSWGWNYRSVLVGKLRRYWDWNNVLDPFKVAAGIFKAIWLVGRFRPDVHFSKGGYASLPVIVAGWVWRVPLVIHDSDAKPGLTTRLAARFARKICLGFAEAKESFSAQKVVVTGTPVRGEILKGNQEKGRKITGFSGKKPVLLVMGGSLGSQFLNQVLAESLDRLLPITDVIHLTGKGKTSGRRTKPRKGVAIFEYVNEELPHLYALADLVVARAGANSMAELQALGKPCLWVPLG